MYVPTISAVDYTFVNVVGPESILFFWSYLQLEIPKHILDPNVLRLGCLFSWIYILKRPVPLEGQTTDPELRKSWGWWNVKEWTIRSLNRLYTRWTMTESHAIVLVVCSARCWWWWSVLLNEHTEYWFAASETQSQEPESKASAQTFQTSYAQIILECFLQNLYLIPAGEYIPDSHSPHISTSTVRLSSERTHARILIHSCRHTQTCKFL